MKRLLCLTGGLVITVATVIIGANMPKASADDATTKTTTASVTVTSSCMLEATEDEAHVANIVASTYRDEIGKTTLKSTCNDINGYSLYAIGYTNTEWGRNDMLGSNTGRTISTGTATSGDTSAWAMKLTAVEGAHKPTVLNGFNVYANVPNEYTKVASYNNTTGDGSEPSKLETTYAVYVTGNQAPDTYIGKVKYTLVHSANSTETPCAGTYNIVYNANGGTGKMDFQTSCADVPIGLLPNGFLSPEQDKQFAVWNTEPDGSGHSYLAGQSVANLSVIGETVTLYALWAPKFMQDLTPSVCKAIANDFGYRLYDRRDGSDYTVRYFKGACWMTQNLRLAGTVNSQYSNFSTYENFNPCAEDLTLGNSSQIARCHVSNNELDGVYYNFPAASAGTVTQSNYSQNATEDICPKGWRLPNITNDASVPGSVDSLLTADAAIFSPVQAGSYNNGSIGYGSGYWWQSSYTNSRRYVIWYSSGNSLSTNGTFMLHSGVSIRCVRAN